jgi:hypothetical protein
MLCSSAGVKLVVVVGGWWFRVGLVGVFVLVDVIMYVTVRLVFKMAPASSSSSAPPPAHTWERLEHAWESRADHADFFSDSDEEETFEETGEEAGLMFMEFLLSMHFSGHMSAKSLCVLCWWASRAGAMGLVSKYAFRPNASSGHFQRHVDSVNGHNLKEKKKSMCRVSVPRYTKHDAGRSVYELPVQCPHEVLCNEVLEDPSILERLATWTREGEWPPSYYDNDVVKKSAGKPVLPIVLYVDGVRTTRRDGVIGFWCYNLITMKRFLIALLRKSETCRCGCRGWCSIVPIFEMIRWSFQAFAQGVFPTTNWSGQHLSEDDGTRFLQAGKAMPCIGALTEIRGDWMEFVSTFGLASWSTEKYPCFVCHCDLKSMHKYDGFEVDALPWAKVSEQDYDDACKVCETHVAVSKVQHAAIAPLLDYDKRKDGALGRSLLADYGPLGLEKKDRLEPCRGLLNVENYELIDTFPYNLTWWRRGNETRVRRRNPLLSGVAGVGLHTFRLDLLHCLYLGVAQDFGAYALWALINAGVYVQNKTQEETARLSVMLIRQELWAWYAQQQKLNTGETITQVQDLTVSMLGPKDAPELKTKGHETKSLMPFVVQLLRKHVGVLGRSGGLLIRCGEAILGLISVMRDSPRRVSVSAQQMMHDHMLNLITFWKAAELNEKPKLHLLCHLIHQAAWSGNPSFHTTFADEGMNKVLADISRSAHRSVFEVRVFAHFDSLTKLDDARSAKKRKT